MCSELLLTALISGLFSVCFYLLIFFSKCVILGGATTAYQSPNAYCNTKQHLTIRQ